MNYIILIPFKVPGDSLVEFDSKFSSKICKTYDELFDKVIDISENDKDEQVITTYIPLDDFLLNKLSKGEYSEDTKLVVQNVNYSIVTFAGDTITIVTRKDLQSVPDLLHDISTNRKVDNEKYEFRKSTILSNHPLMNSEICTQLMRTARNYLLSKIDISLEGDNELPKRTCLDILRYLVKEKYAFLEDIRMVTQECSEKTPYDAFSKFMDIKRNYEVRKFYKFNGKNMVLINYILDHIILRDSDELKDDEYLLKDSKDIMDSLWFHTPSGYVININSFGNITIKKEYIIYTEEDMSMSLFDFN